MEDMHILRLMFEDNREVVGIWLIGRVAESQSEVLEIYYAPGPSESAPCRISATWAEPIYEEIEHWKNSWSITMLQELALRILNIVCSTFGFTLCSATWHPKAPSVPAEYQFFLQ